MPTEQQLTDAGWTNVRPAPRGGLMGESETGTPEFPPPYAIHVDGDGAKVEGVIITHRPAKGTSVSAPRIPRTTVPSPVEAAGLHEEALAKRARGGK